MNSLTLDLYYASKIYFIDGDNVPNNTVKEIGESCHVLVFKREDNPQSFIHPNIHIFICSRTRDAADFMISCYVSRLDLLLPNHIPFCIITNDHFGNIIVETLKYISERNVTSIMTKIPFHHSYRENKKELVEEVNRFKDKIDWRAMFEKYWKGSPTSFTKKYKIHQGNFSSWKLGRKKPYTQQLIAILELMKDNNAIELKDYEKELNINNIKDERVSEK